MLKVIFNTWTGAFFNPGGGEIQLLETKKHLERRGCSIGLYDVWKPVSHPDIFHQFSIQEGVHYPMSEYRQQGVKIALSTILWGDFPTGHPETERIRSIMELADILFTNSVAESDKISRNFNIDREKFYETRNGVADEYLNKETNRDFKKEFGITGDFILSVANIDRRKNTHQLVKICDQLGKQLLLIGEVRDQAYFDRIRSDHSAALRYLGPVRDIPLLKSAYQQARLFALPSLCETPGIAALEAASQGCPLLITSEGCAQEYFSHHAVYVDPLNAQSIRDGIVLALDAKRSVHQLERRIVSEYSWAKAAEDVESGYRKLLGM